MENTYPPASLADRPYYSAHFMDPVLWEPFVRWVGERHGFECKRVQPGLPGSFPTFIVERGSLDEVPTQGPVVVKFFGPLFDGQGSFQIERAFGHWLAQHSLSIRSPAILAEGQLNSEWAYLVFEHISGTSFGQARSELPAEASDQVVQLLGRFTKELHVDSAARQAGRFLNTPKTWQQFTAFVESQHAECSTNHQLWLDLPAHLIEQLPAFLPPVDQLIDQTSPPHWIHADLTADHLLGRLDCNHTTSTSPRVTWQSLGIIDWGDSRVGNILYELMALHFDFFQGDRHLLRLFLEAYGLPVFYRHEFPRKAFSMALLHQFPLPPPLIALHQDARTLDELAERLFGI